MTPPPPPPTPPSPPDPQSSENGPMLSSLDIQALDALVNAGMNPSEVPEHIRDSAEQVHRVMDLVGSGSTASDPLLVDVVMARIARLEAQQNQQQDEIEAFLTPIDEEALDAWVLSGFTTARVAGSLRDRAVRHQEMADLITHGSSRISGSPALIAATLDRVQTAVDAQDESLHFDQGSAGRGFRLTDIVSIAAMFLIGTAVLWPALGALRQRSQLTSCQANFGSLASAFSLYAGENQAALPQASTSLDGGRWWEVNTPASNSANLFLLAKIGYTRLDDLACGGNPEALRAMSSPSEQDWHNLGEISYSYRIMFGPRQPGWGNSAQTVVLSDRSPVVRRSARGFVIYPQENSPNHAGKGQVVLFGDGSTRWLASPELASGDNIWLPRGFESMINQIREYLSRGEPVENLRLRGEEVPADAVDAFVGP